VYTRASLTDILARIHARKSVRACPARGNLNGEVAGHADILATILVHKSARMSVSVSVSVTAPWNSSFPARSEYWRTAHVVPDVPAGNTRGVRGMRLILHVRGKLADIDAAFG